MAVPDRSELRTRRAAAAADRADTEERTATDLSPEERVLDRERAEELHSLIRLLRFEQQHLLALRYGAGLGYEEIGAIVGAAPATVRVRMHRILEELRARYPHDDE